MYSYIEQSAIFPFDPIKTLGDFLIYSITNPLRKYPVSEVSHNGVPNGFDIKCQCFARSVFHFDIIFFVS